MAGRHFNITGDRTEGAEVDVVHVIMEESLLPAIDFEGDCVLSLPTVWLPNVPVEITGTSQILRYSRRQFGAQRLHLSIVAHHLPDNLSRVLVDEDSLLPVVGVRCPDVLAGED